MKNIMVLLLIFVLGSCASPNEQLNAEIAVLKTELEAAKNALAKNQTGKNKRLIHEVYFNLKDDLSDAQQKQFNGEILRLKEISEVKNFQFGAFTNLGDLRALADYEMIIKMEFDAVDDYKIYQNHKIHLEVKSGLKDFLAGPPASYDYFVID